ncbi:cell envelope integrity protein TolA, partial [Aeromonas rivipollensis]
GLTLVAVMAIIGIKVEAAQSADANSWSGFKTCKGFDSVRTEADKTEQMVNKLNEINTEQYAIKERRAMALVEGKLERDPMETLKYTNLVLAAGDLKEVIESRQVRLNEWKVGCMAALASMQAPAKSKTTAQMAEEARLQKEMAAYSLSQTASVTTRSDVDKYAALISATINRYMILDPTMRGKTCTIGVKLTSSGFVHSVDNGQGDPSVCRSGRAAVLKANQLPVPKDPAAFEMLKEFKLNLAPDI